MEIFITGMIVGGLMWLFGKSMEDKRLRHLDREYERRRREREEERERSRWPD